MKKVIGFAMIALASLSLAACGSQSNGKSANKSGDIASKSEQPTATNKKIAKELEAKFNTDGEKNVETKIQTDVADDTDKTGHQVIQVILTNQDSLKNMKAAKDALDSNTANDTQKLSIKGVQVNVEEEAKKLANDKDQIEFGWTLGSADQLDLIAKSTKTKNLIDIVE
ncbi:hypothetical protein Lpp120_1605 [Lacticaseibacillus paracasei subsp. paracasei Lpp120]|nr:hypothetical protein Lpp120_1605 [Lacticaseibacillus paracasei subsp. paracasei Lpp120]